MKQLPICEDWQSALKERHKEEAASNTTINHNFIILISLNGYFVKCLLLHSFPDTMWVFYFTEGGHF